MFHPLPIFVGLRYVRTRRQGFFVSFISWVSMLGVCLGVITVLGVLAAGLGAIVLLARHGFVALCYDPFGQGERHGALDMRGRPLTEGTEEHTLVDIGARLVGNQIFEPKDRNVVFAMLMSYFLSRTLVPACSAAWLSGSVAMSK